MPDALGDFTQQASAYAVSRPTYPADLIDRLIARVGVRRGDPVADLGAGTGIFTRLLIDHGFRVTALEPNDAMRREALADPMLASKAVWTAGSFESTGLPDHSQRWLVAAQAFHWADPPRALPEARRVLQPIDSTGRGGALTVLWNDRDMAASAVLRWTRDAMLRAAPNYNEAYRNAGIDWAKTLTSTGDFTRVATEEAHHVVPMPRERYLNLWRSHNRFNQTAGTAAFAAFLAELENYLAHERLDTVDVPYVCRAWTAT